jgi:hypothetical protein
MRGRSSGTSDEQDAVVSDSRNGVSVAGLGASHGNCWLGR